MINAISPAEALREKAARAVPKEISERLNELLILKCEQPEIKIKTNEIPFFEIFLSKYYTFDIEQIKVQYEKAGWTVEFVKQWPGSCECDYWIFSHVK